MQLRLHRVPRLVAIVSCLGGTNVSHLVMSVTSSNRTVQIALVTVITRYPALCSSSVEIEDDETSN